MRTSSLSPTRRSVYTPVTGDGRGDLSCVSCGSRTGSKTRPRRQLTEVGDSQKVHRAHAHLPKHDAPSHRPPPRDGAMDRQNDTTIAIQLQFAIIRSLLASPSPEGRFRVAIWNLSERDWTTPDGRTRRFSAVTIEHCCYAARKAGVNSMAALRRYNVAALAASVLTASRSHRPAGGSDGTAHQGQGPGKDLAAAGDGARGRSAASPSKAVNRRGDPLVEVSCRQRLVGTS